MSYGLIFLIIVSLYWRTRTYKHLIDDQSKRSDYLWTVIMKKADPEFYQSQRSLTKYVIPGILVLTGNSFLIHYYFGFWAALLYAVHPLNVSQASWMIGRWYGESTFLTLISHGFLVSGMALPAALAYGGALMITVNAIPMLVMAFFILPSPQTLLMAVPLILFLTSKRFRSGLKGRAEKYEQKGVRSEIHWRNLFTATNVVAYYINICTGFFPTGFFHHFGRDGDMGFFNKRFLYSFAMITVFVILGVIVDWKMTLWFILFIGVFSQIWSALGMFVAERYVYVALVGYCVVMAKLLPETALIIIATLLYERARNYTKAHRSCESLFNHSIINFPKVAENYVNLSSHYMDRGEYFSALKPIQVALALTKGNKWKIYLNAMNIFYMNAFYSKAYECGIRALETCDEPHTEEKIHKRMQDIQNKMVELKKNQKYLKKKGIL